MQNDLAQTIAGIIDPPAWADRAALRAAGRRVLRESERTRKMDEQRRATSLKKAKAILEALESLGPDGFKGSYNALEERALQAEVLLSSMMKGGEMLAQALGEAGETFGFLHASMFGAESHLRQHGWIKPAVCNCQAPPTHMSNDCPIHGLDDMEPF
ncbi:hypothetical protein CG471_18425 [Sphingobium sp. IP1]|uniref:Uncharacterized protein n=1 Tax=Sphingobium yanoikuyae TaxID=13690 RepID=A0A9X7UCX8_SPHYA|nr:MULTISPECIES: hypothetical protein [Sphingobium]PHP18317.1 hypothetical protein CG471_18425 [Sphingobium sp. IP1]QNG46114.1 hypothetical protein H3V42_00035 [Sphingobium yanoikuyae]